MNTGTTTGRIANSLYLLGESPEADCLNLQSGTSAAMLQWLHDFG
jgi:hypothetical protein